MLSICYRCFLYIIFNNINILIFPEACIDVSTLLDEKNIFGVGKRTISIIKYFQPYILTTN